MDGLSIGEASDLIDYLKELPGGRQGGATRRRAANRGGKVGVVELRPLLNRPDVLVVDVETTGLGDRAEVLAVAVIDTTGRVLLDTVSMPPGTDTDRGEQHARSDPPRLRSMGARPWPEVHGELVELLRGAKIVIAWNVEYDSRLLHQTAKRHGLTLPSVTWRCAMEAETTTRGADAPYAKLRGDVLSGVLDLARRSGERQSMLGTQELIETGTEQRPSGLGEREVATEIEQGALANASADTLGTDQAIGEVVFAVGGSAGLSAADEHGMSRRYGEQPRRVYSVSTIMALHWPILAIRGAKTPVHEQQSPQMPQTSPPTPLGP